MKRLFFITLLLVLIAALVTFYFLRTKSGFNSIYLVPEDAISIVETDDPIKAWDEIIHSNAWNHYRSNKFFSELNSDISYLDSLITSNKFFLKLLGQKPFLISQHLIGNKKYDFLYIAEIGKVARYKNPEMLLSKALGKDFEISSRDYKGYKILDILDNVDHDYCFMSLVNGKLIFSFSPMLIEHSIDASSKMTIGRDVGYLSVQSKVHSKGLFNVFLIHKNLNKFIAALSPEARESFKSYTKDMLVTGLSFGISPEGFIDVEGFSSFSDEPVDAITGLLDKGSLKISSSAVIPTRIASLIKINFEDAATYIDKSMKTMGDDGYKEYTSNMAAIEKRLKINLSKNVYSWMKDEVVLLQTQPSNLGRTNEFAAVLYVRDSADASENLHFIWKQIKKNTPVKIKSVDYNSYTIDYIAFPGILKVLFGKMLDKIEKPYITQIGESVIISNHPQTIKNIIDDYMAGKTLYTSEAYTDFTSNFPSNTGIWLYIEPPVLYNNLKALVNADTWLKIQKNKKYITCLSQAGLQINKSDDLLHIVLKAQYQAQIEEWNLPFYNPSEMLMMFDYEEPEEPENSELMADTVPEISISDFDAKEYQEFYSDGAVKFSVEIKKGYKHGDFKCYYPSGELHIKGKFENDKPSGIWKYYSENGDLIKTDTY